ncbi:MAG: hypothetical protein EXX96DRAFT_634515 [Benjaminiella poitrasii]|nr:MAG: hypothetical protein EXX96DRAFT_634515 [Benjaminiella poitrasii]
MSNVFNYEDRQDNLYNEQGMRVYDPMEDALTEPLEKLVVDKLTSGVKSEKRTIAVSVYTNYSDKEREQFIAKMIECAQEKGATARVAHSMGINARNAQRWWKQYREDVTMPYKKSSEMKGRPSTFTNEHDSYLIELIDDDSQIIVSDIMERLTEKFEGFIISNSQLNHHLKDDLCLTMKKATFEQSLNIATTIEVKQEEENHVDDLFKKVLRDSVKYKHVNGLKLDRQPMLVNGHNKILEQIRRFVNCIAKFGNHSILVTSFDLFWHNQPLHDDSAFGSDVSDFLQLLMVGGYVFIGGNLVPFLGSFLENFEFQDESSCEILIPTAQQPYMNTERLLDQYFKNCSYQLWSYHCLHSYLKKFIPIIPVHFYGHASQKHKTFNIYHFASELLYILCSKQAITKDMIAELWLSFTRTTFYENAINGAYIVNFQEMKNYLDGQEAKNVYAKLLVKVAIEMEAKCPNYPASIFGLGNGRKNALDVMMDGLKETIRKQNVANAMTRKKEFRL